MIELTIPGRGVYELEHLVCDVNGTLAVDGQLLDGLPKLLTVLRDRMTLHLITADTQGKQAAIDHRLNTQAVIITGSEESLRKAEYVHQLGAEHVVAIGQGSNDAAMLQAAKLGICILSQEGTAIESLLAADLLAPDIYSALELLEKPLRIVASLRK